MGHILSKLNFLGFPRAKKAHFLVNVFIGLAVAVFFHLVEHSDFGENMINLLFDMLIKAESARTTRPEDNGMVFIDIDNNSYAKWNEPLLTPRDRLAGMIECAAGNGARVIVLDILLEDRDCCNPAGEDRLRAVLEGVSKAKGRTRIIFPFRVGENGKIRRNLFDDLIDKNSETFYRASPLASATVSDMVKRYWLSYETAVNDKNETVVLWGMPLLAAVLNEDVFAELKKIEPLILKKGAGDEPADGRAKTNEIEMKGGGKLIVPLERENLYVQRIRFQFMPGVNMLGNVITADNLKQPSDPAGKKEFRRFFEDKVVIIGNSSPDVGDIHPTPVGYMPGIYIIGNALHTIKNRLQPTPIWSGISYIIELIIIFIASYVFLYWKPFSAQVIMTAGILFVLVPLTWFFFFRFGVFLNVIFPVIGINIRKSLGDMERFVERSPGKAH